MLGWLTLAVLTSSATFCAVAVALRARLTGRAELVVVSAVVFAALVVGPVFLLGYTGQLVAWRLAVVAAVVHAASFALSGRGRLRAHAALTLRALRSLVTLPFEGLREAWRARSIVTLALVVAAMIIGWSAIVTYLATSDFGWDSIFYHEPIVGFAIQNHGFSHVELPRGAMFQTINGYPRVGEALALWFVIFTDRTFIEIGNTLAAAWLMFAIFALARRYGNRVTSMGWGAIILFEPAVWTQLRTVYVDIEFTFFAVAAIYLATRPSYRVRDAVLTMLALALVTGMKGGGMLLAPPIALVSTARLLVQHGRRRFPAVLAVVVGGVVVLSGVAALTLVPNWVSFKNPVWPLTLDVKSLGLHFDGLIRLNELNQVRPLATVIDTIYSAPIGTLRAEYGSGLVWVILPAAIVSIVLVPLAVVRDWLFFRRLGEASNLFWVVLLGLIAAALSTSLVTARYNMSFVVTLMAAITWVTRSRRWQRLGEGIAAAAIVLNFIPFVLPRAWDLTEHVWDWNWGVSPAAARELLAATHAERAWMTTDPSYMPRATALRRETELGPGDRVAFTQDQTWLAALWNSHFTNEVRYIPFEDEAQFLARLNADDPKWVVVGAASRARSALAIEEWELIGDASPHDGTVAFRHLRPPTRTQ